MEYNRYMFKMHLIATYMNQYNPHFGTVQFSMAQIVTLSPASNLTKRYSKFHRNPYCVLHNGYIFFVNFKQSSSAVS